MHPLEEGPRDAKLTSTAQSYDHKGIVRISHFTRLFLCSFSILLIMLTTSGSVLADQQHVSKPLNIIQIVYPSYDFLGCGTGWNNAIDGNLQSFRYAYTTGSQACSQAVWDIHDVSQNRTCSVNAYIPTVFATANISYGFYRANGSLIKRYSVNQYYYSGEVTLGDPVYGIHHILIQSNNGENGTYMGAAYLSYDCG
ncbi:hypothetical protein [Dictyobacter arantiisoli]|uniref:Uncharacterized protein n=1 Tax=Dictyobacter arantiisoli TaxID=2014874 RepID=A0A5A5T6U6_9CHLR|nr:hypothetical protein [Dictyobacter arantiisoli]GCF06965.1 hypothetical protein KDI_05290 [Dictyobacter arantiisoli]